MEDLAWDVFETDWGWIGVAGSAAGIRCVTLPETTPDLAIAELTRTSRCSAGVEDPAPFAEFRRQVRAYLAGDLPSVNASLDLPNEPAFFRRAWGVCRTIPPGETRSYKWVAEQAGRPGAFRAAGQAMARNPVPFIVPCHRVVASDGSLHGFGGPGIGLKARLLGLEGGDRHR